MATITTDTYLDGGVARSAGEAWTINSGAIFTIRTDTRWHANAPASMTGTLGAQTCNEGEIIYDGRNIRWLPFDTGSGNVPAIGTDITQGGVTSSYLLGVYANYTSAPTAVGNAMPASGFIKFREVDGSFTTGALTGIGASATGPDVTGWIEIVADDATTITLPRLGSHTIRGDWFYLDDTDGTVGQVIQIPTNGGGANTYCPGLWIENSTPNAATYTWSVNIVTVTLTSHGYKVGQTIEIDFTSGAGTPNGAYEITTVASANEFTFALTGSGTSGNCTITSFEYWPSLNGATNGWARQHIGGPYTSTDVRQNFVKSIGSGQIQIGEASDLSATYANVAAQSGTYVSINHTSTYTWADDIVTVTYTTGHLLTTGQQVGLDFTSGDATADGNYTITVIDAYTYTVPLAGSGTGGNVTARPGYTITFTAHALGVGDTVYCDFTTGGGVDGEYTIYAVTSANAYLIEAPLTTAQTSANVSVYSRYAISFTAHALALGNRVYLDFTTGAGVDGIYTIVAIPDANTFHVVANNGASADSGNVTVKQTIGNIPASGLRTRIPNVFLRGCTTAARASNNVHATIASRAEWATTTAGALDLEYAYSTWYHNYAQAFSVKLHNGAYLDSLIITECASALDINNFNSSMHGGLDAVTLTLTSNFAGGNIKNSKFKRGNTPGSNDHCISISFCANITFSFIEAAIIQYARGSGKSITMTSSLNLTFNNCRIFTSDFPVISSFGIRVNDLDIVDRNIGYTNVTSAYYSINITAMSDDIVVDGITYGYEGLIPNVHSAAGVLVCSASSDIVIRNVGSHSNRISGGSWRPNLYGMAVVFVSGGNNNNIKLQRVYLDKNRTGVITTINSDKNMTYESVMGTRYVYSAMATYLQIDAGLNSNMKGFGAGANTVTGQSSVYGTHFRDLFLGDTSGRLVLAMNESTSETENYFTMVSGTEKFNSAGGILMGVIGDQAIWEDSVFRLGHTGFANVTPTMSGGTIGNYTVEYQIDSGSGFSGSWATATGANLSAESISPSGFKMKVRITTTSTNATAITYLRFDTISSSSAQADNLYTLDTATITLTNLIPGSRYEIYNTSSSTTITNAIAAASTATITASASNGDNLRIRIRKSIDTTQASTYTWSASVVEVTFASHGRYVGEPVDLEFTSGDGMGQDGIYTIASVPSSSTYTVSVSGSGTGGNVSATPVKYLPIETGAIIDNLSASAYISQIEDIIA
ncbi:MAG: hypothetical protein KBD51_02120 [Candidatus Levybacteria bacterium]|nr:hypothetical protein [Candidatus Levybacteria bacterium]